MLRIYLFSYSFYSVNVRNLLKPNYPLVECFAIDTVLKVANFLIRYLLEVSNSRFIMMA